MASRVARLEPHDRLLHASGRSTRLDRADARPTDPLAQFGLLGFGGFAFFLAMHWIGNIVGHANAELIPIPSSKISTEISSNPISYHALHHARFDGHYGFAAATMDRLMGTEFSDWLAVHRRVFAGQPLESLRQKLD